MKDPRKERILEVVMEYLGAIAEALELSSAADFKRALADKEMRERINSMNLVYLNYGDKPFHSIQHNVRALMREGRSNRVLRHSFRDATRGDPLPVVLLNWPSKTNPYLIALSRNTLGVALHTHLSGHLEIRFYIRDGQVYKVATRITGTGVRHSHKPVSAGTELFVINISPEAFLAKWWHPARPLIWFGEVYKHEEL